MTWLLVIMLFKLYFWFDITYFSLYNIYALSFEKFITLYGREEKIRILGDKYGIDENTESLFTSKYLNICSNLFPAKLDDYCDDKSYFCEDSYAHCISNACKCINTYHYRLREICLCEYYLFIECFFDHTELATTLFWKP